MPPPGESLYHLLPAVIRQRDLRAGAALQQLLAIIDDQAGKIERDLERMYDNWFIETCDDWVVPYIGDLLGYELPPGTLTAGAGASALERVLAPRQAVGNLIAKRHRKGTASVLEALARDVTSWPARAVEYYQRLVVAQHLDHLRSERIATIDLRDQNSLLRPNSAFDTSCSIADVRRIGSTQSRGHFNITNVGLHVYRQRRYPVTRTAAYCREDQGLNCYTFSVLGNDAPLFRLPQPASDPSQPSSAEQMPLPIGRFELEASNSPAQADPKLYGVDRSLSLSVPDWPRRGGGGDIPAAAIIPADLSLWSYKVPAGCIAVDPVLGRIMFPANQQPAHEVTVNYGYGFAMDLGGGEYPRTLPPMPAPVELAVTRADNTTPAPGEFPRIALAVADWQSRRGATLPADKRAAPALFVQLVDSGVYQGNLDLTLQPGESVWIIAASGTRPVLWLADYKAGSPDAISVRGGHGSRFTLDGVLIAGRGIDVSPLPSDDAQDAPQPVADLCEVLIRHSTLVPGWGLQHDCEPNRPREPSIVLNGSRTCLRIEHSIVGAIRVVSDGTVSGQRASILIDDSVVDATSVSRTVVGGPGGEVAAADLRVARSTMVGETLVHAITLGENTLFVGQLSVARRQSGCVHYCYVPPGSRTPRRHRCQPETAIAAAVERLAAPDRSVAYADVALRVQPNFVSMRYGVPDYLRLQSWGADEIRQGADDSSEMGVYHDLFEPQRIALLEARLADAVPAGVEASVLLDT